VGLAFLTSFFIEKSLSVDNLFVFVMLFSYFRVPPVYQHRILFWGIVGVLIMRAIFIAGGNTLLKEFHGVVYVFGAFLVFTGLKIAVKHDEKIEPERNVVVKIFRRFFPVSGNSDGGRFFVKENGRRMATPLLLVLLLVETTDVVFAVDSIPAILAVTRDMFIVYTSNVFAILGLRALYFALAGMMRMFQYLHYGLAALLVFVGLKMIVASVYKLPVATALGVITAILDPCDLRGGVATSCEIRTDGIEPGSQDSFPTRGIAPNTSHAWRFRRKQMLGPTHNAGKHRPRQMVHSQQTTLPPVLRQPSTGLHQAFLQAHQ
jgi:tellurite resistance protein TerC